MKITQNKFFLAFMDLIHILIGLIIIIFIIWFLIRLHMYFSKDNVSIGSTIPQDSKKK